MERKIVIEYKAGTYKSFESDDPGFKDYPLKGITYPVDYGYIEGYTGEDGDELDVLVGTGKMNGYIKVYRYDIPELETKIIANVTQLEWKEIIKTYDPVVREEKEFSDENEKEKFLSKFKLEN